MKKFKVQFYGFTKEMTKEEVKARFEKFLEDPPLYNWEFHVECTETDDLYYIK